MSVVFAVEKLAVELDWMLCETARCDRQMMYRSEEIAGKGCGANMLGRY